MNGTFDEAEMLRKLDHRTLAVLVAGNWRRLDPLGSTYGRTGDRMLVPCSVGIGSVRRRQVITELVGTKGSVTCGVEVEWVADMFGADSRRGKALRTNESGIVV